MIISYHYHQQIIHNNATPACLTAISPRLKPCAILDTRFGNNNLYCTAHPSYDSRRNELTRAYTNSDCTCSAQVNIILKSSCGSYSRATAGITSRNKTRKQLCRKHHSNCIIHICRNVLQGGGRLGRTSRLHRLWLSLQCYRSQQATRAETALCWWVMFTNIHAKTNLVIPDLYLAKHACFQDSPIVQH